MEYWDNVKNIIHAHNTTQEWVATQCSIDFGSFKGWIAKDRLPRADDAVKIAQVLNTTVEYLVTGIEPPDSTAAAGSKAQEYSQVIDDLKIIDSSVRAGFVSAIHAVAEETRRKKNRQGGSAAS
jgi:hypothetical protein